jgi:ribonucleoside-diphosphate reductase beta chain
METITIKVGPKSFVLDKTKAEAAFANKRVINGRETMFFNILPLKYQWAYDLYQHDEGQPLGARGHPDAARTRAVARPDRPDQRRSTAGSSRWPSATSPPPRASSATTSMHVVREVVTAPELKLVLGRHAHEENIHADSLLYMISSLGINPHECEAMFEDIPTIVARTRPSSSTIPARCAATSTSPSPRTSRLLAHNIFVFGQCMEGTQFYGLFGMVLSLAPPEQVPRHRPDVPLHAARRVQPHRGLPQPASLDLVEENPEIWTPEFKEELRRAHARAP